MAGKEMTAPWTPRERRMRASLEGVMELAKEWSSAEISFAHPLAGAKERNAAIAAEKALEAHINAALADQPPPDQRDEALRLAEEAIRGVLDIGKRDMSNPKYDGYFDDMDAALAAIAAAKGEK